mgnify:CR=1 FL=1
MILVAIAALLGVVIGLALPKISPSIGEITGEYIASGPAADALNGRRPARLHRLRPRLIRIPRHRR